jgi:hypothetical protein
MMFLDCPAYLDEGGARRCGLPAEVRRRFTVRSSDGPLEAAMIRCPSGHWFNGPIESLTWKSEEKHPRKAGAESSATYHFGEGLDDGSPGRPTANYPTARDGIIARVTLLNGRGGTIVWHHPGEPWQEIARPNSAPAYYLGRPARMWITAMSPRRRRKPLANAQNPTGEEQPPNPAHEPSQARA